MALSAEDKAEVQQLVTAGAAAALTSDAGKAVLTELVGTAVGQATTSLTKTLEAISGKVETLATATPPVKPAGGGKDNPKDIDAETIKAAVEAALKPVNERFAKEDAERTKASEAQTREGLIKKTLTDKKYSALANHKTFVRDLHARGVKTEAEVEAALNDFIADQKALGVEIKPTAASPEGEGATKPGAGAGGGGDGKPLSKEEKAQRLKQIAKSSEAVRV